MKIFKLNVLALGLVATLALSSCGNGQKKATTEEKAATEAVAPEQVKEEGCGGNCEGCPNAAKEEVKQEEGCGGSCEGCPGEKKECGGTCDGDGDC